MVGVVVDRPVGENDVGLLGLDDLAERLVMCRVDDRLAVRLTGVKGPRLQDLAGLLGLRHPRLAFGPGRPFAPIQVEQDYLVPQVGVAGDRAAAAVLGIAGMAAGDDHLEPALGLVGCAGILGAGRRWKSRPDREARFRCGLPGAATCVV